MANQSILNAFERFWQHTVNALGTKADRNHTHDDYIKEDYDLVISTNYDHNIFEVEYGNVSTVYEKYKNNIMPRVLLKMNFVYNSDYQNKLYESNSVHVYYGSGKQVRIKFDVMNNTYTSEHGRADKQSILIVFNGSDIDDNIVSSIDYIKEDDIYDAVINFEMPYGSWIEQMQIENFSFASDDISRIYSLLKENKPAKVLLKGTFYMGTGYNYISNITPTDVCVANNTDKMVFISFVVDTANNNGDVVSVLYNMRFDADSDNVYTLGYVGSDYSHIPCLDITFNLDGNLNNLSSSNISYYSSSVIDMWNYLLENDNYIDSSKYKINIYGTTDFGSGGIYKNKLNITHLQVNEYSFMLVFTYINNNDGSTGSGHIYFSRLSSNMNSISNVNVEMLTLEYRV